MAAAASRNAGEEAESITADHTAEVEATEQSVAQKKEDLNKPQCPYRKATAPQVWADLTRFSPGGLKTKFNLSMRTEIF